ncbi:MAG: CapA family protein [Chloroflexi bacterium]|nr:CapA family protein [Chloroflexota bacterium]
MIARSILGLSLLCLLLALQPAQAQRFCGETAGRVETRSYTSALIAQEMRYSVYLPPCYDTSGLTYPVVYLMHGSASDNTHWLNLGLAQVLDRGILQYVLPPMIVVLPYGDWIANENWFNDASWANIFLNELLPDAEAQYRISARALTRAIGGISRGGFWAYHIALRHPDLFSAVGGHSAFFDEFHAPPEQNPLDLALTAPGIEALRLWLDRGRDDYAQVNLDLMDSRLTQRGLAHTYTVYPEGQHEDAYWAAHVAEYMQFYAAQWPLPAPENDEPSQARFLLVPAVAFPSLHYSIDSAALRSVAGGAYDPNLILGFTAWTALQNVAIAISPDTRVVMDDELLDALWRERTAYTLLPFDDLTTRFRMLRVDEMLPIDHDLAVYPFAWQSAAPNYDPARLTRILLSGVTALARNTLTALDQNGLAWAGEAILPYVSRADFFHMSNEVSFAPRCPASDEPVLGSFCAVDAHFDLFTYLGADIIELTGNHNNDYGYSAYLRTLAMFHDAGMVTIGGGRTLAEARTPYSIEHNGSRIAMLACNWNGPYYALVNEDATQAGGVRPGAAYCEMDWLSAIIPQLAAASDVVVVTVQYAEYEQYTPIERQVWHYRQLADLGADIVVGTQAHKPQTFEFYTPLNSDDEVLLHYGMGNLFFDQPFWGNRRFFMDQLLIYTGRLLTVDLFTGIIDDLARPRPMTAEERLNFLQFMFIQENGF